MSLNSHDNAVFNSFYYYWLVLTLVGCAGVCSNVFIIFVTLRAQTKEMSLFYRMLINIEVSTTFTLITYTVLINQIFVDRITYFMGFFTLYLELHIQFQHIYQRFSISTNYMAYVIFGFGLYNQLIPPTSWFHMRRKGKIVFLVLVYSLGIILTSYHVVFGTQDYEAVPNSDYGFFKGTSTNQTALFIGALILILIVTSHMVYSFKTGPVISPQTRRNRNIFVKTFLLMFTIPFMNALFMTFLILRFVPAGNHGLKNILSGCSYIHLFLSNISYVIFIKPLRVCALKIIWRKAAAVQMIEKHKTLSSNNSVSQPLKSFCCCIKPR